MPSAPMSHFCLLVLLLSSSRVQVGFCNNSAEPIGVAEFAAVDATVTGNAGDFVILPCRVSAASRYDHLRWFGPRFPTIPLTIGDVTFATDPRISVERESLGHEEFLNLVISFVSADDAGVYRCCCHGSPASEQSVFLNVVSQPTIERHRLNLTTKVPHMVRLGDNATLECSTWLERSRQHQDLDLDLDWAKLGSWPGGARTRQTKRWSSSPVPQEVHGGRQWARSQLTATLTIPNVRLTDAGVYECRRSVISQSGQSAASGGNGARIRLKVHLSRSQHKYFMSTTTPAAAAARPTPPSGSAARGADSSLQRIQGADSMPQLPRFDQQPLNDAHPWRQSQRPPPPRQQPQSPPADFDDAQSWWPPQDKGRRNGGSGGVSTGAASYSALRWSAPLLCSILLAKFSDLLF